MKRNSSRGSLRTMRTLFLLAIFSTVAALGQQPASAPPQSAPQSTPAPAATNPAAQLPQPAAPVQPPATPAGTTPTPTVPTAPTMGPGEAYLYAMQPFNHARSAPNDLTEADQWALGIGVSRAKAQCDALGKVKLAGEDLLAFGKLCIFGQDFDPARQSLIAYLALPQAKSPELGRLLLTRAFLGLQWIPSAESQLESLLSLYPYDASIHLGIDMVVDTAAASETTDDLDTIPRLNEQQLPHTLDALAHGGVVPASNGDQVDAALLVEDALRCADTLRRTDKQDAADAVVAKVMAAVAAGSIVNSALYPAIQNALARYGLPGQASSVRSLRGDELPMTGTPVARVVPLYDTDPAAHIIVRHFGGSTVTQSLDDRTLVIVFSLAGPASQSAIQQILARLAKDHITPRLRVMAVTSFAANVGADTANAAVLEAIRAFRSSLPPTLPVYLVPDVQLQRFAIDRWPAAILLDGKGKILWLNTLSGSPGSILEMERDMESPSPFTAN
jgi:hypothetical protein